MGEKVNVRNRSASTTGYTIPELRLTRSFAPGEIKQIEIDELKSLSYVPGGQVLLDNYLIVEDEDALKQLNMQVEPEYFYTKEDIEKVLDEKGTERLEDTLNFAPEGVKDIIKQVAVETELPDTRKREIIAESTGFSVDNAINVNKIMSNESEATEEKPKTKTRRKSTPVRVSPAEEK